MSLYNLIFMFKGKQNDHIYIFTCFRRISVLYFTVYMCLPPYSTLMFWDLRVQKWLSQSTLDRKQKADQKAHLRPDSVPDTFEHLDRTWKPLFRVLQGLMV